jgi:hypothetical protein
MNRWDEYLAATVRLDEVRRESAATVAAQQATAGATLSELAAVRQRISLQRTRLVEVATGLGRAVPLLEPLDAERATVVALTGQSPIGVAATSNAVGRAPSDAQAARQSIADATADITVALQRVRMTLDASDATLSGATSTPAQRGLLASRPAGVRNAIVYGWFALLALVAVIEINSIVGDSFQASVVVAVFSLIVPAGAWILGWLTLRLLFGRAGVMEGSAIGRRLGDTAYRPPGGVVGAMLCAVPLIVGLVLSIV